MLYTDMQVPNSCGGCTLHMQIGGTFQLFLKRRDIALIANKLQLKTIFRGYALVIAIKCFVDTPRNSLLW